MKVTLKRQRTEFEEVDLPTFHTTFFRSNFFDGEKLHSISYKGDYIWLYSDINDALNYTEKINESDKEAFVKVVDKAIEKLQEIKMKAMEARND